VFDRIRNTLERVNWITDIIKRNNCCQEKRHLQVWLHHHNCRRRFSTYLRFTSFEERIGIKNERRIGY